jgi:hypothetical protein
MRGSGPPATIGGWTTTCRSDRGQVILTARVADSDPVVSVFSFEGRRIASVADYPSMEAAQSAMASG